MKGIFSLSHVSAGFTAVLVGYTSSVVIIIQAATQSGADPVQIESWLLVLGIMMGLTSIGLSWFYKMPILTAWSTPGAAMLVVSAGEYQLSEAIGAFVVSGLMITVTGLIGPLSETLKRIPSSLGTAMLAAILLPFCLKGFEPLQTSPILFIVMFLTYLLAKHLVPRYAMLLLLSVALICGWFVTPHDAVEFQLTMAKPAWMPVTFNVSALLNLALPLYLITMISQNLPGVAMMKSYHYQTPVKSLLITTGVANMIFAPFGGFSANLAAISAAICMNDSVDADKNQRYKAVIWAGLFYLIAGLFATSVVALFIALPADITSMLASFALLGTLLMCLHSAFMTEEYREAALLTFLITLSGVSFLGISSTLLGLAVGGIYSPFTRRA